jgi:hypothetical protein
VINMKNYQISIFSKKVFFNIFNLLMLKIKKKINMFSNEKYRNTTITNTQ